jgi:uncharacterized protein
MPPSADVHRRDLIAIVEASPWFMNALAAVASLSLASWCIGAGAVRNLVWDRLHGYERASTLTDVDVAYFDEEDLSPTTEKRWQASLEAMAPDIPWEVTNQAAVHLWFEGHFGHAVEPLRSLEDAVASWPEFATCVGVTLDAQARVQVISPWGLEDLFAIRVRRNPKRVSLATYRQRTDQKQYAQRWPRVMVEA